MGREREDKLSIVEPGNSVLGGIELIHVVDKPVLLGEFFQVNDQGSRRTVKVALVVEERATHRTDEFAGQRGRQALEKCCTRVID